MAKKPKKPKKPVRDTRLDAKADDPQDLVPIDISGRKGKDLYRVRVSGAQVSLDPATSELLVDVTKGSGSIIAARKC